jgi:benzoyl-CoA 2,3-dioxygenase component B
MFTFFTDRDGKFQLKCLAESGFDPLSRTCAFMLTEEAHHMFVGATGIARVIRRGLEVMDELGTDDPAAVRRAGAIDLPTVQRYINFWFTSSLDLFGAEVSSNAASYFAAGIKGRPDERRFAEHLALDAVLPLEVPDGRGGVATQSVPLRNAMNEVTRRAYVHECGNAVDRWNRLIAGSGHTYRLRLPSPRFHRAIGAWAGTVTDPDGRPIAAAAWQARHDEWLPSAADRAFVGSLMQQVTEPGKMAGWIAPPERGIDNLPIDYEYVRL